VNKAELVEALAEHYDGSRADASRALNAVVQTITRSTVAGEKVAITGFGVFERVERPARIVRNPRTGERKEAPATAVPRFRAGTELKAYVAGQRALPEAAATAPAGSAPRTTTRRPADAAKKAAVGSAAAEEPGSPSKKAGPKKAGAKKSDSKGGAKKADSKKTDSKKADSKKASAKKSGKKKAKSGK
jgi:DNA-binding protein HU-beta